MVQEKYQQYHNIYRSNTFRSFFQYYNY